MNADVVKARKKQPGLIVVDRAVKGKNPNYLTPENKVPDKALPYPWESCIIARGGWSWVNYAQYKSSHDVVHMLVGIVCKGGNLLLKIAPGPDGTWHDDAYDRLEDIGEWMKTNSEAVYSTRAIAPYKETKIRYTNKKDSNIVYAIYLPEEGEVVLPSLVKLNSFVPVKGSKIILFGVEAPMSQTTIRRSTLTTVPRRVQQNPPVQTHMSI